ncbi:MAG: LysE family translocator [Marinibacterium sp.]|nr:LysE family translocator [Marinibacterium sp.]
MLATLIPADTLVTFTIAVTLLALAPGPDNIFVLTQSALNGARAGVMVVLGLCTGLIFHSLAVALGVAALVQASAMAFTVLKLAGAGYLIYLAWGAFRAPAQALSGNGPRLSAAALFRRGLIMNITNPKVAIFFLAFFPQFTSPENGPVVAQIAGLGAVFMAVTFVVFSAIALLAGGLSHWLMRSQTAQIVINRLAGLVFLGLAGKILLSRP